MSAPRREGQKAEPNAESEREATHLDAQSPFLTTNLVQPDTTLLPNLPIIPPRLHRHSQLGLPFRKLPTLPLLLLCRAIDTSQLLHRIIITRQSSPCPSRCSWGGGSDLEQQSPMTPRPSRFDDDARPLCNPRFELLDILE